ncbi:hypothetical protein [Caulobacter sp. FWC26]|uniref:hypothetical protein n=1 Tax=Caulobacter sp. FWC26 TaxID=69665 RepID=UPI000FD97666|nr:hypothetical protein [Caulobacter sp. FWC26]
MTAETSLSFDYAESQRLGRLRGAVLRVWWGMDVSDEAGESMLNMKVPTALRDELKKQAADQGVTLR